MHCLPNPLLKEFLDKTIPLPEIHWETVLQISILMMSGMAMMTQWKDGFPYGFQIRISSSKDPMGNLSGLACLMMNWKGFSELCTAGLYGEMKYRKKNLWLIPFCRCIVKSEDFVQRFENEKRRIFRFCDPEGLYDL
jgi:hypothetical protein